MIAVLDFGQVLWVTLVAAGASIVGALVASVASYKVQKTLQSQRLTADGLARAAEREAARTDAATDRAATDAAVRADRERATIDGLRATQRSRLEPVIRRCIPAEEALGAGFDEARLAEEAGRIIWVDSAADLYLAAGTSELISASREARDRCRAYATAAALSEDLRRRAAVGTSPSTLALLEGANAKAYESRTAAQTQVISVRESTLELLNRTEQLVAGQPVLRPNP